MNCERDIRFELLARLCPNSTGADIRSVCTEAGMFAIRARRKTVTEKDFLESVNKVCSLPFCIDQLICHDEQLPKMAYTMLDEPIA